MLNRWSTQTDKFINMLPTRKPQILRSKKDAPLRRPRTRRTPAHTGRVPYRRADKSVSIVRAKIATPRQSQHHEKLGRRRRIADIKKPMPPKQSKRFFDEWSFRQTCTGGSNTVFTRKHLELNVAFKLIPKQVVAELALDMLELVDGMVHKLNFNMPC